MHVWPVFEGTVILKLFFRHGNPCIPCQSLLLSTTAGLVIFEDIKFCGFSKFCFKYKFSWKNFWGYTQPEKNILSHVACSDKICDPFEYSSVSCSHPSLPTWDYLSVIWGHDIYTTKFLHPPLERCSRAEENLTIAMIVLLWLLLKMILLLDICLEPFQYHVICYWRKETQFHVL